MRRAWSFLVLLTACLPEPEVDLAGPRVVGASLAQAAVEVPVVPDIEVEFSESLDPATVSAGAVVMVRWQEVGRCDLSPVCARGSCAAGRCWKDPLTSSDLSALDRGESAGDVEGSVELEFGLDDAHLAIEPATTLEPRARYSLVLGEGVHDVSGASLEDQSGLAARWRSDFVTAGEGSAGPSPRLWFPAAGATRVPTNLVRVETWFALPTVVGTSDTLRLGQADGTDTVELVDPVGCDGWVPGFCAAWKIPGPLPADASLQLVGGTLVDGAGRGVVLPHLVESFRTAEGPDEEPPSLAESRVAVRGACVVARVRGHEPLHVTLRLGDLAAEATGQGDGEIELAVRIPEGIEATNARVEAVDLAGNTASEEYALDAVALAGPHTRLTISELLANPAGPEPHQEFVELVNFGADPIALDGLWLSDLVWEEVASVLGTGSKPPGDPLPAGTLAPGQIALLVAAGYDAAEGSDEPPAPSASLLHVDASLAQGGLKNAGEPLTVYRADPPTLIASYGNFVDTAPTAHGGRSVSIVRPDACDVRSSWASHPLGRATPGRLP